MVVGFNLPSERGFALDFSPSLGERQKKALFATQSAYHGIGFAFSDRM